jgi:sugar-specific transcriptional regulator TrmB
LNTEKRIETLTRLGLTLNQARTYLTLVQSSPLTAKELARSSGITRQDIYRVIPTLQNTGLVEQAIAKPATFRAIPIELGLSILLRRRIAEHNDLQKRTEILQCDLENCRPTRTLQQENSQFVLVPGKETIVQKIKNAIQDVHASLDVVTSWKRFGQATFEFAAAYKGALERGAKIRVATEKPGAEEENTILETTRVLGNNPNFKVKHYFAPPKAVVSIFDEKEVLIMTSATAGLAESSALWTDNSSVITVAQNYFETVWSTSLSPIRSESQTTANLLNTAKPHVDR